MKATNKTILTAVTVFVVIAAIASLARPQPNLDPVKAMKPGVAELLKYANQPPRKAEPPPPATDPSKWLLMKESTARAAAAAFVFGDASEKPPPSDHYPYRKQWAQESISRCRRFHTSPP